MLLRPAPDPGERQGFVIDFAAAPWHTRGVINVLLSLYIYQFSSFDSPNVIKKKTGDNANDVVISYSSGWISE